MIRLFLLTILFFSNINPDPISKRPDIFIYGGKYTETDFSPILIKQNTNYLDSYINVIGLNMPMNTRLHFAYFETEVNIVKHFGIMNHYETNAMLLARAPRLFGIPMSIAFGEGFSLASENPKLENREKGIRIFGQDYDFITGAYILKTINFYPLDTQIQIDSIKSRNLLNAIILELDYGFPNIKNFPRIFMRVHHRSGVFGLYCPPDPACGSNFVSYGIKISI